MSNCSRIIKRSFCLFNFEKVLYGTVLILRKCFFHVHFQVTFFRRSNNTFLTFLYLVSLHCVYQNVSSNRLPWWLHSHISCICLTFPQHASSDASSKCLLRQMRSHTCQTSLQRASSDASSNHLFRQMQSHSAGICEIFRQSAFSNVSSNCQVLLMYTGIGCICMTFLPCAFLNEALNYQCD